MREKIFDVASRRAKKIKKFFDTVKLKFLSMLFALSDFAESQMAIIRIVTKI